MHDPRGNQGAYALREPYAEGRRRSPEPGQAGRAVAPREASDVRRMSAVALDAILVWSFWYVVAAALNKGAWLPGLPAGAALGVHAGILAGASFANQVLLTLMTRASVGKLLTGVRVVRAADGHRSGPFRLTWRWLSGLCWLPLQPYYWLRSWISILTGHVSRGTVGDNEDGELYEAICGLRYVRRKDLARVA
ncbi:RDD family protein [Streptomyces sp. NPDC046862]|uniref:RDD family protein n=1 Tax=Streptomyces sp. NPDC046862 TaxID=3154603 RepID=UPI0034514856